MSGLSNRAIGLLSGSAFTCALAVGAVCYASSARTPEESSARSAQDPKESAPAASDRGSRRAPKENSREAKLTRQSAWTASVAEVRRR